MYEDLVIALRLNAEFRQADCALANAASAADAIEGLEEKAMTYAETLYAYEHPWISVTERLPKEGEVVLTWGEQGVLLFDWLRGNEWCCFGGVTHWMPLPKPPTEQMVTDSNRVQEDEV